MRYFLYFISLFFITSIFSTQAYAYGAFLTNGLPQVALAEIKMAVVFDGTKQTIITSNTFSINPLIVDNFVWLMPVPSKPKVSVLKDSVFTELDKRTQKKFNKDNFWKRILYFDINEETHVPAETFSHTAYIKNPIVFSSADKEKAIQQWLYEKGDFIPKNGIDMYKNYLKKGWYFAGFEVDAVHMEYDATDSLTMSGAHTLPVAVSFLSKDMSIPLQFSVIQPDRDSTAVPLSFPYGSLSENVLGAKDSRIDDLLSTPSSNRYPPLPQDLSNIKIELYIFNNQKMEAEGFTTFYADWIDVNNIIVTPKKQMFLTRMYRYIPLSQLEDVSLIASSNNQRVNPTVTWIDNIWRIAIIFSFVVLLIKYRKKIRRV